MRNYTLYDFAKLIWIFQHHNMTYPGLSIELNCCFTNIVWDIPSFFRIFARHQMYWGFVLFVQAPPLVYYA